MNNSADGISRRELLRGHIKPIATAPTLADGRGPENRAAPLPSSAASADRGFPIHRPPRAIAEQQFLNECTRCGDCITACPHQSIVAAPIQFRSAAGTPMINAAQQACWMCPDQPCVSACQPRALDANIPIAMGTASVDSTTCLAHQGLTCTVCHEQCPVDGAIEFCDSKPVVHSDRCTGCGVCFFVCPAPEKAILLIPTRSRGAQIDE